MKEATCALIEDGLIIRQCKNFDIFKEIKAPVKASIFDYSYIYMTNPSHIDNKKYLSEMAKESMEYLMEDKIQLSLQLSGVKIFLGEEKDINQLNANLDLFYIQNKNKILNEIDQFETFVLAQFDVYSSDKNNKLLLCYSGIEIDNKFIPENIKSHKGYRGLDSKIFTVDSILSNTRNKWNEDEIYLLEKLILLKK